MLISSDVCYLLLYETKESLKRAWRSQILRSAPELSGRRPSARGVDVDIDLLTYWSEWWTRELGCRVWYALPGELFLLISEARHEEPACMQVLHQERAGWIRADEWIGLKEISGVTK